MNKTTWPAEYLLLDSEMVLNDYYEAGDMYLIKKYYNRLVELSFDNYYYDSINLLTNGDYHPNGYYVYLIDWPETERDNFDESVKYNCIFNAIAYNNYKNLAEIAKTNGKINESIRFLNKAQAIKKTMIEKLYNEKTGSFSDGIKEDGSISNHYSQRSTAYALCMGIYDDNDMTSKMVEFIGNENKMSIYGTFFLMPGLYSSNNGVIANKMLIDDSSEGKTWSYLLDVLNVTLTPEAWSSEIKDNMTFSHPW